MSLLKIIIQLISLYRAVSLFVFIILSPLMSVTVNTFLLITAASSDLLDGYLARKFDLTTEGGRLLDLFSDKYLNCILTVYLIIEQYAKLPLIIILTKELFILSFRSIKINNQFVILTNRVLGGLMTLMLLLTVIMHINNLFMTYLSVFVHLLGLFNFIYLLYKIGSNASRIKEAFKK